MNDFEWRRRLQGLKRARDPARDLWPAIEQVILASPHAPRRRRPGPWLGALAAGLIVALGLVLWRAERGDSGRAPATVRAGSDLELLATRAEALAMELAYRGAIEAALGVGGQALLIESASPDVVEAESQLLAAEGEIERALAQSPESTLLIEQLRRTNDQRMRLVRLRARLG
jgi:hypothetical protein